MSRSALLAQSVDRIDLGLDLDDLTWDRYHGIDCNTRFEFLRHRSILTDGDDLGLQYEKSMVSALNDAGFVCVGAWQRPIPMPAFERV